MSIQNLKERLPEYAKDLKLNLSSVLKTGQGLNEQQVWGTALASAIASRNAQVLREIAEEAAPNLSEDAQRGAKLAAALMGMNNIYYRFLHLASEKEYAKIPAGLRMNAMMNPGVDKLDFELWSLAVSSINGCGMCIDSHEQSLTKEGLNKQAIQQAVKIASVIHAVAATLEAESVLEGASAGAGA